MSGLIIKDFKLLKVQMYFFLAFIAIAFIMQTTMDNTLFIIGYMTFCGSMAVLNTISYDEYDNGNAFLFSLPISRKGYVLEKYVFGFVTGGAAWLFAVIASIVISVVKHSFSLKDTVIVALMYLALLAILLSIMLPVQLKFGGEKRMYVIFGIGGIVGIIAFISIGIIRHFNNINQIMNRLSSVSSGVMTLAIVVIAAIAVLISYRISISIMNKKEF